jgi:outer membrane protein OmpA-like peptidoglycan-associated protein
MKLYLPILVVIAFAYSANGQQHTYNKDTAKVKNCFDEYYEAFVTRGARPVPDGEQNVVFSARKNDTCFCGEGKVFLRDGKILPSVLVKKTDGTYEPAKKVLHPNVKRGEGVKPTNFTVYKGMSSTFLTDDYYVINLFFIDYLKRKVVPNAQAPSPNDIEGIQIQLSEKEKEIVQKAYEGLKFANGKSEIMSSSFPHLNLLATMLSEKPDYKLTVNGYTDNVGKAESNLTLSQRRAEAVKDYLVKQGIDASRIKAEGFGMESPIADNTTKDGRAKNRRVEFIMTK